MIVLKITAFLLGATFTLFGYFIFFRKKYFLINGFEKDFKRDGESEKYAMAVGLIEFIIGIVFLAVGIILIIFA